MTDIRPGRLRHSLEIQEPVETRDAEGGVITTYTTKHKVWGDVRPIKAEEFLNARGQVIATITHKITTRYVSGVDTLDRICFNGRNFGIYSVLNIEERNRMLEFQCREVTAGASSS